MGEQEKTIKEYLTAIKKQNNRATAPPYFFVIRDERWIRSDGGGDEGPGDAEKIIWNCIHDPEMSLESEKAVIEYILESDDNLTEDDAMQALRDEWEEVSIVRIWRKRCMFLTETDANEHLRKNRYHYSENAHTYIDHAFRAPELENFLKALFEHFGIKDPWYYETIYERNKATNNHKAR